MLSQVALLFALLTSGVAHAQTAPAKSPDPIEPLLKRACVACHNEKVKQGGLDLSSRDALLRGSEHGPVVVPGNPAESQLYKLVAHLAEPGMPFKGNKLPEADIVRFEQWIK